MVRTPPATIIFCQVAFPLRLQHSYTYRWDRTVSESEPQLGDQVSAPFGNHGIKKGWVVGVSNNAPENFSGTIKCLCGVEQQALFDERLLKLSRWLSKYYFCTLGEVLEAMLPSGSGKLQKDLFDFSASSVVPNLELTAEQQGVLDNWLTTDQQTFSYLYGVTGSGKTEVFLRAAEHLLAQGLGVIYLVPAINLIYQLQQSLSERFGEQLALLHSRLTAAQRLRQWRRIQSGKARFVLGARSAVFAPVNRLALIIVDEEQEESYKESSRPRYHARQVAMYRCQSEGARLLLGSASPSVSAWQAMAAGRINRLTLKHRVCGELPQLRVVDLNNCQNQFFAPATLREIEDCCAAGQQTIVFLNQRGYSQLLHCQHCRQKLHCVRCSITLTIYKRQRRAVCHHCGYSCSIPDKCQGCGSSDVVMIGFGTEKLEDYLRWCFPDQKIARMDSDTTAKVGSAEQILKQMELQEIAILVGTQMVTRGLHFPNVQLVVVVLADSGLNFPDFRASERSYIQLLQVAGRAGRGHQGGKVIIQSYQPASPVIAAIVSGDADKFYQHEIAMRADFNLPPSRRLLRLLFLAKRKQQLAAELARWSEILAPGPWQVLGPAPCAVGLLSGWHRAHILLSTVEFSQSHEALSRVVAEHQPHHGIRIELDCDPLCFS